MTKEIQGRDTKQRVNHVFLDAIVLQKSERLAEVSMVAFIIRISDHQ